MTADPLTAPELSSIDDLRTAPLQVRGLRKSYRETVALDGVDLDVHANEVTVIVGPSGAGRSTLLRCINHLERPSAGAIDGSGQVRIGMVFQGPSLFPQLNLLENVAMASIAVYRVPREPAVRRARELLDRVGLTGRDRAYADELTAGQQQRAAIARALAAEPELILFDDPTSAVEADELDAVLAVMRDVARSGLTMVVATHEIGFVREVADRVVFLEAGRIVACGTPAEVIGDVQAERETYFPTPVR